MTHLPTTFLTIIYCACFFWGTPGIALSQGKKITTVRYQTVYFDVRSKEVPQLYTGKTGERKLVSLSRNRISSPQKAPLRNGTVVDFFLSEDAKKPVASASVPAGAETLLLFVAPKKEGYSVWGADVPQSKFGKGASMIINTTSSDLAIRHGAKTATAISAGGSGVLKIPEGFKQAMLPVQIYEREQGSQQWKMTQSTRWAIDDRFRTYIIIYRKPGSKSLLMHGVPERMTTPPETQP